MPPKAKFARQTQAMLENSTPTLPAGGSKLFGLSADFPRLVELPLDHIDRNPNQPRKVFDADEMRGLADSIARHGLQQPITVSDSGGGRYLLVAGERRYRAHEMLGKPTIFALITDGDPDELALIENVQRVDLNALEMAEGYRRLIDRHGYTHEELGAVVGRSQADVSNTLALLSLSDEVRDEYLRHSSRISRWTLIEVARGRSAEEQMRLWLLARAGATLETVREERQGSQPRVSDGRSLRKLATVLRQATSSVQHLAEHRDQLSEEHRNGLRALRASIDALLGEDD